MSSKKQIIKLVIAAMFLALAMVLPFLTGQMPELGSMFLPMHFPVFLCGFFAGPFYGFIVGLISPFLRFTLFGRPIFITTGFGMTFELAVYGLVSGFLYRKLHKSKIGTYVSLIVAMLLGRIASGIALFAISGYVGKEYGLAAFVSSSFTLAIPGIILQLILIPLLVNSLKKYTE